MSKVDDLVKLQVLAKNMKSGRVSVADLKTELETDRRVRRAIFVARKAGVRLTPVRDGGRAVVAYLLEGDKTVDQAVSTAVAAAKPKKVKAVKVAATEEVEA